MNLPVNAATAGLVYLKDDTGRPRLTTSRGVMARLRVKFTFPQDKIKDPVIWEVGKRFEIVTNIRRADVTPEIAAVLELDGEADEIERALKWVAETGVRVDPVEDTIIEG
jgi:hypothetical protein